MPQACRADRAEMGGFCELDTEPPELDTDTYFRHVLEASPRVVRTTFSARPSTESYIAIFWSNVCLSKLPRVFKRRSDVLLRSWNSEPAHQDLVCRHQDSRQIHNAAFR